jgi:hypothetical protein
MGWATFWSIFSPTHLVTLVPRHRGSTNEMSRDQMSSAGESPTSENFVGTVFIANFSNDLNQGCQTFLGTNLPKREKYTK